MPIVEVNGQELEFPDDMTPDAIRGILQAKFPKPEATPSLGQKLKRDAVTAIKQSAGPDKTAFQQLGNFGDFINNAAGDVAGSLMGPDAISAVNSAKDYIGNSMLGRAAGRVAQYVPEPISDAMRFVAPVAGAQGLVDTGKFAWQGAKSIGQGLKNSANLIDNTLGTPNAKALFDKKRFADVQDVVLPKQTPSEIEKTALQRTSGGGFKNSQIYTPNDYEAAMIQDAVDAGVKKPALLVDNIQAAHKARISAADALQKSLDANPTAIDRQKILDFANTVADRIESNKLLKPHGDVVKSVLDTAQQALEDNPLTPSGLWKARKDFDANVQAFSPNVFSDAAPDKAFNYSVRQVRQEWNKLIADSAPQTDVNGFLNKYTNLSEAINNMAGKLAQQSPGMKPPQGANRFSRFLDTKTGKVVKYGAGTAVGIGAANSAINALGAK